MNIYVLWTKEQWRKRGRVLCYSNLLLKVPSHDKVSDSCGAEYRLLEEGRPYVENLPIKYQCPLNGSVFL